MDRAMMRTSLADELDRRSKINRGKVSDDPVDRAIATTKIQISKAVDGRPRVSARLKAAVCA